MQRCVSRPGIRTKNELSRKHRFRERSIKRPQRKHGIITRLFSRRVWIVDVYSICLSRELRVPVYSGSTSLLTDVCQSREENRSGVKNTLDGRGNAINRISRGCQCNKRRLERAKHRGAEARANNRQSVRATKKVLLASVSLMTIS